MFFPSAPSKLKQSDLRSPDKYWYHQYLIIQGIRDDLVFCEGYCDTYNRRFIQDIYRRMIWVAKATTVLQLRRCKEQRAGN